MRPITTINGSDPSAEGRKNGRCAGAAGFGVILKCRPPSRSLSRYRSAGQRAQRQRRRYDEPASHGNIPKGLLVELRLVPPIRIERADGRREPGGVVAEVL